MTGGMAFVYDPDGTAEDMMNLESIVTCAVGHPHWEAQLKGLIERHAAETGSLKARQILADWADERAQFHAGLPEGDAGSPARAAERRAAGGAGGVTKASC